MCKSCLTELLASKLADHLIISECKHEFYNILIKEATTDFNHDEFFAKRAVLTAPHEAKFAGMVKDHWGEEERIIVSNLKKLNKYVGAYRKDPEDVADEVMYPKVAMEKAIEETTRTLLTVIIQDVGQEIIDELDLDLVFDMDYPGVATFLRDYPLKFAKKLEDGSTEKLRKLIEESIKGGDTIPETIKKLRGEFEAWTKYRAEMVARTEVNRALNASSQSIYIETGAKYKIWRTGPNPCPFCSDLDGHRVGIEEDFFKQGDTFTVATEDREGEVKEQVMNLDYEDVGFPPLHPACVCTITAEW